MRALGIPTPDFAVVESLDDVEKIALPFPLFAKPIAEGTGKGITPSSRVDSRPELTRVCEHLLDLYRQPVLVETFLPGREFTVGIVGTGHDACAVGVAEVCLKEDAELHAYSYVNKERCEELVEYRRAVDGIAARAKEIALSAWQGLGCRDAGRVDLRTDARGIPKFLEVNPLAGLHPEHSDLPIICTLHGIPYRKLIAMIVASAQKRLPLRSGERP